MRKIAIGVLIIILITIINSVKSMENIIPVDAIRLRVVANSNSFYDQKIKIEVKNEIQKDVYSLLKNINNTSEAKEIISKNVGVLERNIQTFLKGKDYKKDFNINFGEFYFPKKEERGIVYEEGYYNCLLVELGAGQGSNWWCILFPPLCLLEAQDSTDIEYKFFVKELINKFLK